MRPISTFSLVARDETSKDLGVVVASKFLAVGSAVPWLVANVGAVATQSYANTTYGPRAMAMLMAEKNLAQIETEFRLHDTDYPMRQYGIVDASGNAISVTGTGCHGWAGGRVGGQATRGIENPDGQHVPNKPVINFGQNYAAQGNLLTGPEVMDALSETYERSNKAFPERLLDALLAADRAGGDARGRQSAAIVVVRQAGGYGGFNDRMVDLRVDDHQDPVPELQRLYAIHRLLFERPKIEDALKISGPTLLRLRAVMKRAIKTELSPNPNSPWSEAEQLALLGLFGKENLEERMLHSESTDGAAIDRVALLYLEEKYGSQ